MSTIAGSTTATLPIAAVDQTHLLTVLTQTVSAITQLITLLQAQGGTGAAAGAATLGGGPGSSMPGPQGMTCCCAAQGAVSGADQIGDAPTPKGPPSSYPPSLPPTSKEPAPPSGKEPAPPSSEEPAPPPSKAPMEPPPVVEPPTEHEEMRAEEPAKTEAPTPPAPPASSKGEQLVAEAQKHLGKPYKWGAEGPDSFDCSGLMQHVAKQHGIDLPRVSREQANAGQHVEKGDIQPGDLVYFQGKGKSAVSHIGMAVGDGKFIHAPKTGDVVKVSSYEDGYFADTYRGARRIA